MGPIFKDAVWQKQFEEEGYVVIPFLSEGEVQFLKDNYQSPVVKSHDRSFHATMHCDKAEERIRVDQLIKKVMNPKMVTHFNDYITLFGNFVVKDPGLDSDVGIHQDWSYIDESQYISFNVWCPLVDTNELNGPLHVLKKSHLLKAPIRYTPFEGMAFEHLNEAIEKYAELLEVPAGHAVVYDSRLIHYSTANRSNETRAAINSVNIPKDAMPLHYYKHANQPGQLQVFEVDENFYFTFRPGDYPSEAGDLGFISYDDNVFSLEDLEELYDGKEGKSSVFNNMTS